MPSNPVSVPETIQSQVDFMLTDADSALALLKVASQEKLASDRRRKHLQAAGTCHSITQALPTLSLTNSQRILLNRKVTHLKWCLYNAAA
jgi:hypothetical protein